MAEPKTTRWWIWVTLLVLVLAGGGGAFAYYRRASAKAPAYRTAEAARGDITQLVTATGQLNAMTNVQVGSQISGIIQKIYVDFNSKVKAGQLVAQLDPATYEAAVHQAQGELASAKAELELTQITEKRSKELRTSDLISQSDYDKALADLHQAQAQVTIREASLARAQVDLDRTTIFSPIDGVVISRNVDVGQTVAASFNTPTLFLVANDLAQMQIDAMISEADVGGIEMGQPVRFTVDAFPYRTFDGRVIQIRNAATTNQNVITYDTVIKVDNADLKLKPGMTANVSVVIAEKEDVLKIPNTALRFRPPEAAGTKKPSAPKGPGSGMPSTSGRGSNSAYAAVATSGENSGSGPRGGGPGGRSGHFPSGPGGGRKNPGERLVEKTVYLLSRSGDEEKLEPRSIRIGISDGVYTEVASGLKEGELIVVGFAVQSAENQQQGVNNPFGGGRRRF